MNAKKQHQWHLLTEYCIHCGIGRADDIERPRKCYRNKKIIPISHLRALTNTSFLNFTAPKSKNQAIRQQLKLDK